MLRRMKKIINGQYIWLYEGVSKVTEFLSFRKEGWLKAGVVGMLHG